MTKDPNMWWGIFMCVFVIVVFGVIAYQKYIDHKEFMSDQKLQEKRLDLKILIAKKEGSDEKSS